MNLQAMLQAVGLIIADNRRQFERAGEGGLIHGDIPQWGAKTRCAGKGHGLQVDPVCRPQENDPADLLPQGTQLSVGCSGGLSGIQVARMRHDQPPGGRRRSIAVGLQQPVNISLQYPCIGGIKTARNGTLPDRGPRPGHGDPFCLKPAILE